MKNSSGTRDEKTDALFLVCHHVCYFNKGVYTLYIHSTSRKLDINITRNFLHGKRFYMQLLLSSTYSAQCTFLCPLHVKEYIRSSVWCVMDAYAYFMWVVHFTKCVWSQEHCALKQSVQSVTSIFQMTSRTRYEELLHLKSIFIIRVKTCHLWYEQQLLLRINGPVYYVEDCVSSREDHSWAFVYGMGVDPEAAVWVRLCNLLMSALLLFHGQMHQHVLTLVSAQLWHAIMTCGHGVHLTVAAAHYHVARVRHSTCAWQLKAEKSFTDHCSS